MPETGAQPLANQPPTANLQNYELRRQNSEPTPKRPMLH